MKRLLSLIKKEFIQIFRDKYMTMLIVFIPVVMTVWLGFATSNELKNYSLIIVDLDQSNIARELILRISQAQEFHVVEITQDHNLIHKKLHLWQAKGGVIIPKSFGKDLLLNKAPQLELVFDAVDGLSAGLASQSIASLVNNFAQDIEKLEPSIKVDERIWYNADMTPYQYMVPGTVAILVTIISMLFSSMALVKEKEMGTLEQLIVTPIKKWELLAGKLIPFLIVSLAEFYLALFIGQAVFGITMQGSYLLLTLLAILYLFTTLGLGVSISVISQTQQQALFFTWFFVLFMSLLSGLFFPVSNMPDSIRWVAMLNPMMYFVDIMREVFQKANQFRYLLKSVIPLTIYGIFVFSFSVIKFQKRID
ncbi:MAG: ABC transporter permease [Candidatus Cloacimonadales bacterium]|jgi:ABC-2 type transport system permease protein|nr:ABC transporter permease [Candidatus Cloacimonadales bacterium]